MLAGRIKWVQTKVGLWAFYWHPLEASLKKRTLMSWLWGGGWGVGGSFCLFFLNFGTQPT